MSLIHKQNLVRRFMEAFGQRPPSELRLPDPATIKLRAALVLEEANELGASEDLTEYLDAVCDLLYVVYGAALAAGFNAVQIDAAFLEVHRSNMSKFWSTDEKRLAEESGKDLVFEPHFHLWVARSRDGKVIKSPSFEPPQLEQFTQIAKSN